MRAWPSGSAIGSADTIQRSRIVFGASRFIHRTASSTACAAASSPSRPPTITSRSFVEAGSNADGFSIVEQRRLAARDAGGADDARFARERGQRLELGVERSGRGRRGDAQTRSRQQIERTRSGRVSSTRSVADLLFRRRPCSRIVQPSTARSSSAVPVREQLARHPERGDAVAQRPGDLGELDRIAGPMRPLSCSAADGLEQHVEGGLTVRAGDPDSRPVGQHAAEHRLVVRRVRARRSAGRPRPSPASDRRGRLGARDRRGQRLVKPLEALGGDAGEQRLLVVEMAVERRAGDAEPGADAAQRQRRDAFLAGSSRTAVSTSARSRSPWW